MPVPGRRVLVVAVIVMPGVAMVLVAAAPGMAHVVAVRMPEALVRPRGGVHSGAMSAEAAPSMTAAARNSLAADSEAGTADDHDPDDRSEHGASPGLPVETS